MGRTLEVNMKYVINRLVFLLCFETQDVILSGLNARLSKHGNTCIH